MDIVNGENNFISLDAHIINTAPSLVYLVNHAITFTSRNDIVCQNHIRGFLGLFSYLIDENLRLLHIINVIGIKFAIGRGH